MRFYIELDLIDGGTMTIHEIWVRVMKTLHITIVEQPHRNIGISLPHYAVNFPGKKLRVFAATRNELMALHLENWFSRMHDNVKIHEIQEVPSEILAYATFSRVYQRSISYLKKSLAYKLDLDIAKVDERIARGEVVLDDQVKRYQNFYSILMKSESNDCPFALRIRRVIHNESRAGEFSTYGLSRSSTVPLF